MPRACFSIRIRLRIPCMSNRVRVHCWGFSVDYLHTSSNRHFFGPMLPKSRALFVPRSCTCHPTQDLESDPCRNSGIASSAGALIGQTRRLPTMTGHASTLMLWLQFLFIHFLNSAFEDGQSEPRYPAWLKEVVRFAVFALPIYAALCAYSLGLRVEQHGWTVARVWAAIATFIAALYGIGYAAAALRRSPWMGRVAPINVGMAAVVAGVLLLATSPILDPKRLSAASQAERLRAGSTAPEKFDYDYLRFDLGRYGKNVLAELSKDSNKEIAGLASASQAKTRKYGQPSVPPELLASRIELFPAGAALDPAFIKYLEDAVTTQQWEHPSCLSQANQPACLMVALDLNGDGQPEILTFNTHPLVVYGKVDGQWKKIGN